MPEDHDYIDTSQPAFVWQLVAQRILDEIRDGTLQPGAGLEAERRLAARYGVSTDSTRRAVAHLRDAGWLITLRGRGTYVRPREDWPQT